MCYIVDSANAAGLRARRTDEVNEDDDRLYVFYLPGGQRVGEAWWRAAAYEFIARYEREGQRGDTTT